MSKPRSIQFSPKLLRDYSFAALANANELVMEAIILHKHGHFARAYFLAVASIEETGKSFLAFDNQQRNLSDSSVSTALRRAMESHSQKIGSAFSAWLLASPNIRESIMPAVNLIVDLKNGREPAMYTDISSDLSTIQAPAVVVREKATIDCIKLATECLSHTQMHILDKTPEERTLAQDQMFAMKTEHFQKIMGTEDFWWYYIDQLEAGSKDMAEAVMSYQKNYSKAGLLFLKPNN